MGVRIPLLVPPWVRNPLWHRAQAVPSLDLRFAERRDLIDAVTGRALVTHTRASSGTSTDASGNVATAATDVPRFTHDPTTGASLGLLVEEARTNLLLRSEEFDNASWTRTGVLAFGSGSTANASTAPSGATTADLLTEDTANSTHFISQSVVLASPYTVSFSFYAKSSGRTRVGVWLRGDSSANRTQLLFNLATGQVADVLSTGLFTSISSSITPVGNDWFRCTVTSSCTAGETGVRTAIYLLDSSVGIGNPTYTGNGTSGILLWGAQLEAGAFATSYIPTTSATVTRAADVVSITSGLTLSTLRALYAEFQAPASGTRGIVSLDDNSSNNRIELSTSGTDPKLIVVSGGVTQADIDAGTVTSNASTRLAATFTTNDFAASVNGGVALTDAIGTIPTTDRIRIGALQAGNALNGPIARLTLWSTAPNPASLTAP